MAPQVPNNPVPSDETTTKVEGKTMNTALKHTLIAMATAALGFTAGCSSESPEAEESTAGGETATEASCSGAHEASCSGATEASCSGAAAEGAAEGAAEASCGEGSCG
jgi:hypothetical protein